MQPPDSSVGLLAQSLKHLERDFKDHHRDTKKKEKTIPKLRIFSFYFLFFFVPWCLVVLVVHLSMLAQLL
jgi:hypothetical protein